jgi:single-stranded DNA-binding protein
LATDERAKRGSDLEDHIWHRLVAWEFLAEQAGILKKDEVVMIEGTTLRASAWKDKTTGNDRKGVLALCQRHRILDGMDS